MRYLRNNTATIVTVGPFYDKTDGVTIETGLTISNERITFIVDNNDGSAPTLVLDNVTGATSGTSNDLNYITNNDAGLMQLELAAANVNYFGRAMLSVTDAANHCPVFHEFMILPANVYDALILGAGTDLLDVNASQLGGTAQTGRDIGANVLLSNGTGTGQISLSSGAVLLQATQTGVTIPTVTTVTTTTNLTNAPTNGDLTATMKASVTAAVPTAAAIGTDAASKVLVTPAQKIVTDASGFTTSNLNGDLTSTMKSSVTAAVPTAAQNGTDAASKVLVTPAQKIVTDVNGYVTYSNTAPLDAAGIRTAIGLSTANLDTQIAALPTDADVNAACDTAISDAALATAANLATVDSNVDAILADTGTDGVVVAAASKIGYALTGDYDAAKTASQFVAGSDTVTVGTNNDKTDYVLAASGSAALTEAYAAAGAAPTIAQILYEIRALLAEKSYVDVTLTTKKLDGSTTAATYTLDSSTTPTSITRAT